MKAKSSDWTLFYLRGVPIKAHWTLIVAVPYFALITAMHLDSLALMAAMDIEDLNLSPLTWGVLLGLGFLISVALHEAAHTLLALESGERVRSITLTLFGGLSRIPSEDAHQGASFKSAFRLAMGPLMSLSIAIIFFLVYDLTSAPSDVRFGFFYLSQINMLIAVMNLVPAFPLDGGRVLRALTSTRTATLVGKIICACIAVVGILSLNGMLILLAVAIFSACRSEARWGELRERLEGLTAADMMHRSTMLPVTPGMPVSQVLHDLSEKRERFVPVVARREEAGGVLFSAVGVAEASELMRVPIDKRNNLPVGLVLDADVPVLKRGESAINALVAMQTHSGEPLALVVGDDGALEGVIDSIDIERSAA